jgi:hypothetical protein
LKKRSCLSVSRYGVGLLEAQEKKRERYSIGIKPETGEKMLLQIACKIL